MARTALVPLPRIEMAMPAAVAMNHGVVGCNPRIEGST
jgi:hypothetical protein